MDRTVSRRSEPSSRTALMGEQPNPWNILQPQVAKSRHRGAKPSRRCRLSSLLDGWVLQSSSLLPLHSRANLRLARGNLCTPPLPLGRPTPHRNCLPETVPRPCPDRYAFRAGRNLPDKEFRYLRTVIVTAAVHRGFGVSPHTWSYDFAETCVFGKQSPGPGHCDPLCEEAPLLPKLRGYFAEFLRESCLAPLGILYLPTCVGFGYRYPFVEGRSSFSWEYGMDYFSAVAPGALAGDPGCFPLDDEAYPPSSHWPTLTLVILRSYLVFRVCLDLVPLSRPAPKQCFTPRCLVNCCASTHFGENQLALGSSGISPLTTTHPLILQHQLAFATAPVVSLNQATAYESPAHSSTGTRSESRAEPPPTAWELTVSCSISLPDGGSFHPSLTVLLHYRSPRSI
ncbi:hypothetical protein VNO80_35259 [Phaseolus coccineus]|uniref:Uncharacterized protein n=1 Tax=Phaseolus coccineus TaxID=3886 RepID=A0AAN9KQP2_PHACN